MCFCCSLCLLSSCLLPATERFPYIQKQNKKREHLCIHTCALAMVRWPISLNCSENPRQKPKRKKKKDSIFAFLVVLCSLFFFSLSRFLSFCFSSIKKKKKGTQFIFVTRTSDSTSLVQHDHSSSAAGHGPGPSPRGQRREVRPRRSRCHGLYRLSRQRRWRGNHR